MPDRKQARAMDLPDYPCPPFVRDIPGHAGSWGWINPGTVAQDDNGYLWVNGDTHPRPALEAGQTGLYALVAWTEDGIALFLPVRGYAHMQRIEGDVDTARWVPLASVMKEPPAYA